MQAFHLAVWRGEAGGQIPVLCHPAESVIFRSSGLSWPKILTDMDSMLDFALHTVHFHLKVKDDFLPVVRPEYGMYAIASALGVDFSRLLDNPRVHIQPVLSRADMEELEKPDVRTAGILPRLFETTEFFLRHAPAGVRVGPADFQSPYNTAYYLRGDDLLLDFYDCPELVHRLLDVVTDTYIEAARIQNALLPENELWAPYRGTTGLFSARLTQCHLQLISADMYRKFVLPYDSRIAEELGPVHIHLCGQSLHLIDALLAIPDMVGFEYDFHEIPTAAVAPKIADRAVQLRQGAVATDYTGNPRKDLLQKAKVATVEELLARELDHPGSRVILDLINLPDVDTGRRLYRSLRTRKGGAMIEGRSPVHCRATHGRMHSHGSARSGAA